MKARSVVKIDPEIMSGTPCFAGTRVPARTLIDYLEGGGSLAASLKQKKSEGNGRLAKYCHFNFPG